MADRSAGEPSARLSGRPPIEHGESIYLDRAIGRPGTSLEVPCRERTIEMESARMSCENRARVGSNEGVESTRGWQMQPSDRLGSLHIRVPRGNRQPSR